MSGRRRLRRVCCGVVPVERGRVSQWYICQLPERVLEHMAWGAIHWSRSNRWQAHQWVRCAITVRLRPNPSLNRTPAGGLSPARRSPVSLLR